MFCPSCGKQTENGIKFCKQCGLALNRVRSVMNGSDDEAGQTGQTGQSGWNEWLKEQVIGPKKSPEEKRLEMIQNGLITAVSGIGVSIFLYFLMNAIANKSGSDAEHLRSIWLAGLIPTLVGLVMLFNAFFISPKIVALKRRESLGGVADWTPPVETNALRSAPVNALPEAQFDYSVTEHTTAKLKEKIPIPASRDTH